MSSTNDARGSESVRNTSALYVGGSEPNDAAVTVQQASVLLGISERAVLKRIQQGTLRARKSDRQWEVWLTSSSALGSEPSVMSSEPITGSAEPVRVDQTPLLEQLQSEVQFLRARIEAADVEKSELRRLMLSDKNELLDLRQRLALTAAVTASESTDSVPIGTNDNQPVSANERAENGDRGLQPKWWQIWKHHR